MLRNGGEVLYNYLTIPKENSIRGSNWNYHGLTVSEKSKYQVVPQAKIDDLIGRTVDKEAIKCIIPMTGSPSLNSLMWAELKKQIETDSIEFLISMQDYQTILEDNGEYFQLTAEQLADKLVPYLQTDLMIQEAINLKAELRNDNIKLVEPKSGTKDRVVCLSYINYIASLIETEWNKQSQDEDFDIDDIQLVW